MWGIAEGFPTTAPAALSPETPSYLLFQDEPRVRVVFTPVDDSGNRQITKIYRTPAELAWRDLFRIPQAQREFQNLQYAFRKKLPVVEPLHWGVARRPGRAWFSQLTTVVFTRLHFAGRIDTAGDTPGTKSTAD